MKCPLFRVAMLMTELKPNWSEDNCLKGECAWWSEETKQCDPTGLIPWVRNIQDFLDDLVKKMPHEGQFRT